MKIKTLEYAGNFENGAFQGEGTLYNESGTMIYEGEFQNGAYHGTGVSYYESGVKKYEGEFYMGQPQGKGISYDASGRKLSRASLPEAGFSMKLSWARPWTRCWK